MEKTIAESVNDILKEYAELNEKIDSPEIIAHTQLWRKTVKRRDELSPLADVCKLFLKATQERINCEKSFVSEIDENVKKMLKEEMDDLDGKIKFLIRKIKTMLLPKNDEYNKNAVIELRVTDSESEAFLEFLLDVYRTYCNEKHYKFSLNDYETGKNGWKYAEFLVEGQWAFGHFICESGIQKAIGLSDKNRTDSVSVAVFAETDERMIDFNENDIKIDIFHSSGAGGQNINKVATAVRLTHIPTGTVVVCRDERSQLANKNRAYKILESKLNDIYNAEKLEGITAERRKQLYKKSKQRVYNFNTELVSDGRVEGEESIKNIMNGGLDFFIEEIMLSQR